MGDLILDRIFDHQNANREVSDDFGVHLKNENLEQHLVKIRKNQISYQKNHRKEIENTERIGKEVKNSDNKVPAKNFSSCEEMN